MARKCIMGIDEVGRGSLAGPIVAVALFSQGLPREKEILAQLKESKSLTVAKREFFFAQIVGTFLWSVSVLDNQFIDRYGIQKANLLVFQEASEKLLKEIDRPVEILADYVGGASDYLRQMSFFKKGDKQFAEIAAASIIAKVYRDNLMEEASRIFPLYNFASNKGYGTKAHYKKIYQFGLSPLHRKSFIKI
ncbi:MAG: ribonuclease HII [Patescibacteria group bacterium]|nr:ribonuclease HII [Patescibacteria group bacterium]